MGLAKRSEVRKTIPASYQILSSLASIFRPQYLAAIPQVGNLRSLQKIYGWCFFQVEKENQRLKLLEKPA